MDAGEVDFHAAYRELDAHAAGSPLAVVQWSPDFVVTRFSPRAEELFGWSAEEILGRRIEEIPWVPEEDWPKIAILMEDMRSRTRPSSVSANRNRRKDGEVIHCEWYNSCLYDPRGRLTSILSLVLDVTARERARESLVASEARLAAAEARLRLVVEHSRDGIDLLDLATGRFAFMSPSRVAMTGFTADELFGMSAEESAVRWHPDDRHIAAEQQEAVARGASDLGTVLFRWKAKSGEYRWFSDSRTVVRDAAGAAVALVGVSRDVTEERTLQARVESSSRLSSLGTLTAGLAHEMNNPLAAALSSQEFAKGMLRELGAELASGASGAEVSPLLEECMAALSDSLESSLRIARIVETMTLLARGDRPRGWCRVSDVVENALALLPEAQRAKAKVTVHLEAGLGIEASLDQAALILRELVSNALYAIAGKPKGRVEVRAGAGRPGMVRMEVVDDGVGIQPEHVRQLFDPFFTSRRPGEGIGLGLPICHAVVTASGGTLSVRSEVGAGSTFTVEWPEGRPPGGA